MDNFNLQDYLASGKLHATSKTLTEGLKTSTNPQENLSEKEDSKKGNESEQKRMEGAIKDDRDHIKNLKKDIEDNEKKLARLKKDYKKDIVKENEEEELELDADYDKGGKYYSEDGAEAFNIQPFKMNDVKYTKHEANRMGKYIVGLEGEELKKFISDYMGAFEAGKGDTATGKTFKEDLEEDARTDAEEEGYKDGMKDEKADLKKMKVSELKAKIKEQILAELNVTASPKTLNDIIYQLLDNGHIQPETADDLLNAISNSPSDNIYEKEEVDVDIDVEDEVDVDVEADDIEIERKGTTAKVEVGLSPEEEIIQDSLKAAMDSANALGNDKLADQIGNTITFFTREYIVGDRS
jgi:hypothetical protein